MVYWTHTFTRCRMSVHASRGRTSGRAATLSCLHCNSKLLGLHGRLNVYGHESLLSCRLTSGSLTEDTWRN